MLASTVWFTASTQVVIGDDGEGEDVVRELAGRGIVAEPVKVVPIDEEAFDYGELELEDE